LLDDADPWTEFRLRTRAFLMVCPPNTYAADWSSVIMHGLPTMGAPPKVPSVIRPGSRVSGSNTAPWGRTRFANVPDRWLGEVDGTAAVPPAFAAVDIARRSRVSTGLVLADAVASRPHGLEEMAGALADIGGWAGAGRATRIVRLSDPDAESPLESIGRLAFRRSGLPASLSNYWAGEFMPEFRLDHYWPEFRVGAEADGLAKYVRVDPVAAIRNEKTREWPLQQLGIRLLRYGWANAYHAPSELATPVPPRGAGSTGDRADPAVVAHGRRGPSRPAALSAGAYGPPAAPLISRSQR